MSAGNESTSRSYSPIGSQLQEPSNHASTCRQHHSPSPNQPGDASCSLCGETSSLGIVQELNRAYEIRINHLEANPSVDSDRQRIDTLKHWVKDLSEHNAQLVQVVQELEQEACHRVALLEGKLQESSELTKNSMDSSRHFNNCLQDATAERMKLEKRLGNLVSDARNLCRVIQQGRQYSNWNIDGMTFHEVNEGDIFGNSTLDQKAQLMLDHKDEQIRGYVSKIQALRDELDAKTLDSRQQKEMSSCVTEEMSTLRLNLRSKDELITLLQAKIDANNRAFKDSEFCCDCKKNKHLLTKKTVINDYSTEIDAYLDDLCMCHGGEEGLVGFRKVIANLQTSLKVAKKELIETKEKYVNDKKNSQLVEELDKYRAKFEKQEVATDEMKEKMNNLISDLKVKEEKISNQDRTIKDLQSELKIANLNIACNTPSSKPSQCVSFKEPRISTPKKVKKVEFGGKQECWEGDDYQPLQQANSLVNEMAEKLEKKEKHVALQAEIIELLQIMIGEAEDLQEENNIHFSCEMQQTKIHQQDRIEELMKMLQAFDKDDAQHRSNSMKERKPPKILRAASVEEFRVKSVEAQGAFEDMIAEMEALLNILCTRENKLKELDKVIWTFQQSLSDYIKEIRKLQDKGRNCDSKKQTTDLAFSKRSERIENLQKEFDNGHRKMSKMFDKLMAAKDHVSVQECQCYQASANECELLMRNIAAEVNGAIHSLDIYRQQQDLCYDAMGNVQSSLQGMEQDVTTVEEKVKSYFKFKETSEESREQSQRKMNKWSLELENAQEELRRNVENYRHTDYTVPEHVCSFSCKSVTGRVSPSYECDSRDDDIYKGKRNGDRAIIKRMREEIDSLTDKLEELGNQNMYYEERLRSSQIQLLACESRCQDFEELMQQCNLPEKDQIQYSMLLKALEVSQKEVANLKLDLKICEQDKHRTFQVNEQVQQKPSVTLFEDPNTFEQDQYRTKQVQKKPSVTLFASPNTYEQDHRPKQVKEQVQHKPNQIQYQSHKKPRQTHDTQNQPSVSLFECSASTSHQRQVPHNPHQENAKHKPKQVQWQVQPTKQPNKEHYHTTLFEQEQSQPNQDHQQGHCKPRLLDDCKSTASSVSSKDLVFLDSAGNVDMIMKKSNKGAAKAGRDDKNNVARPKREVTLYHVDTRQTTFNPSRCQPLSDEYNRISEGENPEVNSSRQIEDEKTTLVRALEVTQQEVADVKQAWDDSIKHQCKAMHILQTTLDKAECELTELREQIISLDLEKETSETTIKNLEALLKAAEDEIRLLKLAQPNIQEQHRSIVADYGRKSCEQGAESLHPRKLPCYPIQSTSKDDQTVQKDYLEAQKMKLANEKLHEQISDQQKTIVNLQDTLLLTKKELQELQGKTLNVRSGLADTELKRMDSELVKLRGENIQLRANYQKQEDLFRKMALANQDCCRTPTNVSGTELDKENTELKKQVDQLKEANCKLQCTNSQLGGQLAEEVQVNITHGATILNLRAIINQQTSEICNCCQQISELKHKNSTVVNQPNENNQDVKAIRQRMCECELEGKLEAQIAISETAKQGANDDISLHKKLQGTEILLQEKEDELNTLKALLAKQKASELQQRSSAAMNEAKEKDQEVKALLENISELMCKLAVLEANIEAAKQKTNDDESMLRTLHKKLHATEMLLQQKEDELKNVKSSLEQQERNQANEIRESHTKDAAIADLICKCQLLEKTLEESQENCRCFSTSVCSNQIAMLKSAKREACLQQQFTDKEKQLREELRIKLSDERKLNDVMDVLTEDIRVLRCELADRENQLQMATTKLQCVTRHLEKLKEEKSALEVCLRKMLIHVQNVQRRNDIVEQNMGQLQEENSQLETGNVKLQSEVSCLKDKCQSLQQDCNDNTTSVRNLSEELNEVKITRSQVCQESISNMCSLRELYAVNRKLSNDNENLHKEVSFLLCHNSTLKENLRRCKARLSKCLGTVKINNNNWPLLTTSGHRLSPILSRSQTADGKNTKAKILWEKPKTRTVNTRYTAISSTSCTLQTDTSNLCFNPTTTNSYSRFKPNEKIVHFT